MKIVIYLIFYEITDIFINRNTFWRHLIGAQLYLCLRLKDRLLYIHSNSSNKAITNVSIFVFSKVLFYCSCYMFLECRLVCTTLCGMLAINKGIVFLTILVCMRKGYLYILPLHVDNRIKRLTCHLVFQ